MSLTERDASILAQVAFKAAIDQTNEDVLTDEGYSSFEARFALLKEKLFNEVTEAMSAHATQVPVQAPYNAEAALRSELGATDDGAWHVEVAVTKEGGQQGPLPAWLIAKCAEVGCRKVFDNRGRSQNPKAPWFKAADGTKNDKGEPMPFWPPKGK